MPTDYFLRYAIARAQPPVDASQDISDTSYENVNGTTTIRFTRPRISTDPDVDISLDHCLYFLYAYGGNVGNFEDPMSVQFHGGHTRGILANRICIPDNCTDEGTFSLIRQNTTTTGQQQHSSKNTVLLSKISHYLVTKQPVFYSECCSTWLLNMHMPS